ncbi:ubiquitin-binding protein CUE5 [Elsinoe australis]|uniref:Ubiquitin-binding protein CUE5 n=1 Tax=Elsinoe australis TaxID=40998 RepID=A0A4U7B6Q4_9PEZI|nr:ubiquitin-binding protein CUE5 [Elsinoe australis]
MPEQQAQEKTPESPTTARQLDFDDDEPQESGTTKPHQATVEDEDAAPSKPARPTSPQQQAEQTLIEAFPSIDAKVVKAVLTASGGQVEPAFNALLGMSDPNFKEEAPPPQPPRPVRSQLEQDEMYARQLAQHYDSRERARGDGYGQQRGEQRGQLPRQSTQDRLYAEDRERSFFDDDLPEIQRTLQKGFMETQTKVNSWFNNFKKRLEGDEDDPYDGPTRLDPRPQQQGQPHSDYYGAHQGGSRTRRSGDYDADPRELGDDFTQLEMRDDEAPPPKPSRPHANPDLFKSTPAPPQSGPVDEVDAAERRATSPNNGSNAKKWQPLTSVAAQPEPEENDPFSVGDSDDEKELKTKDTREADTQRLKDAARKSVSEGGDSAPKLQKSEQEGTKDKTAEELLTGKK